MLTALLTQLEAACAHTRVFLATRSSQVFPRAGVKGLYAGGRRVWGPGFTWNRSLHTSTCLRAGFAPGGRSCQDLSWASRSLRTHRCIPVRGIPPEHPSVTPSLRKPRTGTTLRWGLSRLARPPLPRGHRDFAEVPRRPSHTGCWGQPATDPASEASIPPPLYCLSLSHLVTITTFKPLMALVSSVYFHTIHL